MASNSFRNASLDIYQVLIDNNQRAILNTIKALDYTTLGCIDYHRKQYIVTKYTSIIRAYNNTISVWIM